MSLTTQVEQRRRRTVGQLLAGGTLVTALLGAGIYVGLSADEGAEVSRPVAVPLTTPEAAPIPTDAGTWTAPPVSAGPLILPIPARTQRGVPVGYPHTTEGAISAAARYTQAAVTLDPEHARTVGELAAAPSYLNAADDFANNVATARQDLGVQATGPTGGAYLTYRPQAYQVLDATPDQAEVWVLGAADGAGPSTGGASRTGPSISRLVMVWAEHDWRLTDDTPTTAPPAAPEPGTPQAYEQGWRDLAIA